MKIFAAFAVSPALGLVTAVGVFIHEFIQELSEYFVLRKAGYTNSQALIKNFQVSATIIIGILVAAFLSQLLIEPYLLAITAGVFLTIVLQDLLPETIESAREPGKLLPYTGAFVLGLAIMFGISNVAGHSHVHGDEGVFLRAVDGDQVPAEHVGTVIGGVEPSHFLIEILVQEIAIGALNDLGCDRGRGRLCLEETHAEENQNQPLGVAAELL